eukprot:3932193-Rhodomonas_salina.1
MSSPDKLCSLPPPLLPPPPPPPVQAVAAVVGQQQAQAQHIYAGPVYAKHKRVISRTDVGQDDVR